MPKISIALSTGTNMSCSQSLTIFYMLAKIKMFQKIMISINVKNIIVFGVDMEPRLLLLGDISHRYSSSDQKKISNDPSWNPEITFAIRDTYGLCPGLYFVYNSLVFISKSDFNKLVFLQQTKSKNKHVMFPVLNNFLHSCQSQNISSSHLNNYFRLHVCLFFRPWVCACVTLEF